MFNKVFVEKEVAESQTLKKILEKISYKELQEINNISDVWGRVKRPYLQKRTDLNLFLGNKKGVKVKEAPPAYGHGAEKHYYFIHAYNCIYECQYCYLQGYFNSPDIVLFINHEEILADMQSIVDKNPDAWFHSGEFSDSLALSHITNELPLYYEFFKKNPEAKLEIRTKSVNTRILEQLGPLDNIYVSFSIASEISGKQFDLKCPPIKSRIKAIDKLVKKGFKIGIHFDPIVYQDNFKEDYEDIIEKLANVLPNQQLGYISLGVVRYTKDVYKEVKNNYPDSALTKQDYITSFDQKVRYNHPMRNWMLNTVKEFLVHHQYDSEKIYFCMED